MLSITVHISPALADQLDRDRRYELLEYLRENSNINTNDKIADQCLHEIINAARTGRAEITLGLRGGQQ